MDFSRIATILGLVAGLVLLGVAPCRAEDDNWARIGHVNHMAVTTVTVTNVTVSERDAHSAIITFDIAWDNSWRTSVNHDAAWVFFKVLPKGASAWEHVTLEGAGVNPPGYAIGKGTEIELVVPPDHMGLFVRRAKEGSGNLAVQSVKAVWAISNGAVRPDGFRIMAQAGEMVYVPEGTNTVGSGGHDYNDFYAGGTANAPFAIKSEAEIPVGDSKGSLCYRNNAGQAGDLAGPIPAAFPKGFAACYCMKFEIAEGQWVDFFNTLTDAQKTTRDITSGVNGGKNTDEPVKAGDDPRAWHWIFRNTIAWTTGDATTQERDLACNYLSWADGAAWADWAGLRPMTELEYEKARRAPQGTTAAWGVMYLDSSLGERQVIMGNEAGRAFTGLHGDGKLDANGDANVAGWPGPGAKGVGARGGYGPPFNPHAGASDRSKSTLERPTRHYGFGWRGVRTAPAGVGP